MMEVEILSTKPIPNGRKAPAAFRIWKFGTVNTTNGSFRFTKIDALSVVQAYLLQGNRLTFDYGHAAVLDSGPNGKGAGSFKLEIRSDGLWAVDVRWTDQAKKEIESGEWLYFSPAFHFDRDKSKVIKVINIALTNVPATHNMQPLVAASIVSNECKGKGKVMKKAEMKPEEQAAKPEALEGMAPPGDEKEAMKAKIQDLMAQLAKAQEEFAAKFGPDDQPEMEPESMTAKTAEAPADKPKDDAMAKLDAKVKQLEASLLSQSIDALVTLSISEGRILPKDKGDLIKLGQTHGVDALNAVLVRLPKPVLEVQASRAPSQTLGTLSSEEKEICRTLGVSEDSLLKTKQLNEKRFKKESVGDE
jgi:phage I-like protein